MPIKPKKRRTTPSPIGELVADSARREAHESEEYREARDEYAAIRELRERNWIAAHIRDGAMSLS
jgi:hypothetical protein